MLTADRPRFAARAIKCFLSQTYPNKELIIYDSGHKSLPLQEIENVGFYHGPQGRPIGELRNLAIERSEGRIIAHWDDDDWNHPRRLEEQYQLLTAADCEMVGYSSIYFHRKTHGEFWLYRGELEWAVGTSLMYRRKTWQNRRFASHLNIGEDNNFQEYRHMVTAAGHCPVRTIATHHGKNTSDGHHLFVEGNRFASTNWTLTKDPERIGHLEQLLNFKTL